jgi:hypothetical protein
MIRPLEATHIVGQLYGVPHGVFTLNFATDHQSFPDHSTLVVVVVVVVNKNSC